MSTMNRFLIHFLATQFLLAAVYAQPVHFGVKLGAPFVDAYDAGTSSSGTLSQRAHSGAKHLIIGPMVEFNLPLGFSVEADALYRRIGYDAFGGAVSLTGNSWQFPVLAKYRVLPLPMLHPYLEGGVSFQHLGVSNFNVSQPGLGLTRILPFSPGSQSGAGLVLGAGVEAKLPFLRISPEIRYTRMGTQRFQDAFSPVSLNRDQVDFLVGFTF